MESLAQNNGLLERICERAASGEPLAVLRAELLTELLPMYQRRAQRAARAIGPFVDSAEIESRVLERIWRAIEKSEFTDAGELQRLLTICESRARKDASRSADTLARTMRHMHRNYVQLAEHEAQRQGRELDYAERMNLARSVAPVDASQTSLQRIISGSPMVLAMDELTDATTCSAHSAACETPDAALIRTEQEHVVQEWLANLPRRADRHILIRRYTGEHPMSAPLSAHLKLRAQRSGGVEVADAVLSA